MKIFKALLHKDFAIEFRMKEVMVVGIAMALLMGTIAAAGIGSAFLSQGTITLIFPTLLWISFLFAASLAIARSFEYEFRNGALIGLLLSGASPQLIYLSKLIVNLLSCSLALIALITIMSVLLNVPVLVILPELILISLLVLVGFVAVAVLLVPMSMGSRLKSMLLPILLLPLMFPLFFAGLELSSAIFEGVALDFTSPWVSLLVGFDVVYVAVGVNLFEHVIRE